MSSKVLVREEDLRSRSTVPLPAPAGGTGRRVLRESVQWLVPVAPPAIEAHVYGATGGDAVELGVHRTEGGAPQPLMAGSFGQQSQRVRVGRDSIVFAPRRKQRAPERRRTDQQNPRRGKQTTSGE